MQGTSRKLIQIFILISLHTLSCLPVFGDDSVFLKPWQTVQTRYMLIKYKYDEDLVLFEKAIRFGFSEINGPGKATPGIDTGHTPIGKRVDALFEMVQEILDMKKRFDPVNIHLYSDTDGIKKAYKSLYQGECRLRAWYRFTNNTVYLNVRDLHDGMLAHELAHAVIDNFLTVRPPLQTAEILARYVDTHLERGFAD